jgi:hypothetical protein
MLKILASLGLSLSVAQVAVADVYKYTAPDGRVYYTDQPPNQEYKRIIRTKIIVHVRNDSLAEISDSNETGGDIEDGVDLGRTRFMTYGHSTRRWHRMSHSASANKLKYSGLIAQAAAEYGVDEKLLHAVIQAESSYNPEARSPAGAVGLMQLMPETALRYGVNVEDRTDPAESIRGGAQYLRDLLKMFDSNLKLAVAGYNAGENAVKKYNNSIPPYPETQNYVAQVLALYQQ